MNNDKHYVEIADNIYAVSDGTIYNKKTGKNVGYKNGKKNYVTLPKCGSMPSDWIIATVFLKKPLKEDGTEYEKYKVIHKDGNSLNDNPDNLEWQYPLGKRKNSKGITNIFTKEEPKMAEEKIEVFVIDCFGKVWDTYDNLEEIAERFDCDISTIRGHLASGKMFRYRYIITKKVSDTIRYTCEID